MWQENVIERFYMFRLPQTKDNYDITNKYRKPS